jgi:hypothetical protein
MKKVRFGLKVSTDIPAVPLSPGGTGLILVYNHQRFGNFSL